MGGLEVILIIGWREELIEWWIEELIVGLIVFWMKVCGGIFNNIWDQRENKSYFEKFRGTNLLFSFLISLYLFLCWLNDVEGCYNKLYKVMIG